MQGFVGAWYTGGAFYLPLGALFDVLQIDYTWEAEHLAAGFYVRPRRRYRLDFARGTGEVDGRSVKLAPEAFLLGDGEVYVLPWLLDELFGLDCEVDASELSFDVVSDEMLPPVLEQERARLRALHRVREESSAGVPFLYPFQRQRLGGGVLDYGLVVEESPRARTFSWRATGGAEVLGGGLRFRTSGRADGRDASSRYDVVWHRVIERSPYLTQIRLGDLRSEGPRSLAYRGVSLTNEPFQPPWLFSRYTLEGGLGPGWEAELYLDDRLVDVALDEGPYRFEVPLSYGTTRLRAVEYGPRGEIEERMLRFETPQSLLPTGTFRYTGYVGRGEGSVVQGRVAVGVTDRLTARAGRYRDIGGVSGYEVFYGGLTSRLGVHHLLDVRATHRGTGRVSLSSLFLSRLGFRLTAARFEAEQRSGGASGVRSELGLGARFPLDVGPVRLGLNARLFQRGYGAHRERRVSALLTASYGPGRFRLRYERDARRASDLAASPASLVSRSMLSPSLSWRPRRSLIPYLRATTVALGMEYDALDKRPVRFEARLSGAIGKRGALRLEARRDVRSGRLSAQVRFTYRLSQAQVSARTRMFQGEATVSTDVRGSAGVDWTSGQVLLHERGLVDRGAAAVRFFYDTNGNAYRDAGEPFIEGADVRLRHGSYVRETTPTVTLFLGLRPYTRFVLETDEGSFADPFVVPMTDSFAFTVGPNSVTTINVPLVRAGSLEGSVTRLGANGRAPAGGVLVVLRREEDGAERSIRSFSDGVLFDYALPPGTWVARPDGDQLARLKLESAPAERRFTVRSLPDGDQVTGISFVLMPAEGAE